MKGFKRFKKRFIFLLTFQKGGLNVSFCLKRFFVWGRNNLERRYAMVTFFSEVFAVVITVVIFSIPYIRKYGRKRS